MEKVQDLIHILESTTRLSYNKAVPVLLHVTIGLQFPAVRAGVSVTEGTYNAQLA